MVNVAQSVERRIVIPVVEGSIPFVHPIFDQAGALPRLDGEDRYGEGYGDVTLFCIKADVVKLVYTPDLGSGAERRESSSLSIRTNV